MVSWLFFCKTRRSFNLPSSEMVTLKASSDSERPLGVVSGFSFSNCSLGCRLFAVWWNRSAVSSPVVWR